MRAFDATAASPKTRTGRSRPAKRRTGSSRRRAPPHLELARKLEGPPKDVGVALIGLGVIGVVIPGPIPPGASFALLGVVFVWPGLLARFAGPSARRLPRLFRFLIGFVDDLQIDLDQRYPGAVSC